MGGLFHFDLDTLFYRIVAFVLAFTVHEWAHAFVANKLGDPTAEREGRLTLNPIPHVDPIGMLMILFGPFGWAKPVPFNPFLFKVKNRRLGVVMVAAAGPLTNLILAFLFGWATVFVTTQLEWFFTLSDLYQELIYYTLVYSFVINVALFVFNLFPIAPLDGSKIIRFSLPERFDDFFIRWEQYGAFALLILILIPPLRELILYPPFQWAQEWIARIVGLH